MNQNTENILNDLKIQVSKGEVNQVIKKIYSLLDNSDGLNYNQLIALDRRNRELIVLQNKGVLSTNELVVLSNQITDSVLSFIDNIKSIDLSSDREILYDTFDPRRNNPEFYCGREDELKLMKNQYLKVIQENKPRFILVKGDFGSGKSTLVNRFLYELREEKLAVLIGRCSKEEGDSGYIPFLQILLSLYKIKNQSGNNEERIVDLIKRIAPGWLECVLPYTKTLKFKESTIKTTKQLIDDNKQFFFSRENMFIQYNEILSVALRDELCIILIEDLHFSDESSLQLLLYLSNNYFSNNVLIICTYRPFEIADNLTDEEIDKFSLITKEIIKNDSTLFINLINGINVFEYAKKRYGRHNFPSSLLEKINRKSHGLPIFLSQLFSSWEETNVLFLDDKGEWNIKNYSENEIPSKVSVILEDRIKRIEKEGSHLKTILDRASVAGEEFCAQSVKNLIDKNIDEELYFDVYLEEILGRKFNLISHSFIVENGDQYLDYYKFLHKFFQEYIYSCLSDRTKREIHLKIAKFLETEFVEIEPISGVIANHFIACGSKEKALNYTFMAIKFEESKYSWIECKKWCKKGIDLLNEIESKMNAIELKYELLEKLGYTCYNLGEMKEAHEFMAKALDLGVSINKPGASIAKLCIFLSEICDEEAYFDEGFSYIERGKLSLLNEELSIAGFYHLALDASKNILIIRTAPDVDKLINSFEEIISQLDKYEDDSYFFSRMKARIINGLGICHHLNEDYDQAEIFYKKAYEIANKIGDFQSSLSCLGNYAEATSDNGKYDSAKKLALDTINKSKMLSDKGNEAWGLMVLGEIEINSKDFEAAIESLINSIKIMFDTNSLQSISHAYSLLSRAYFFNGYIEKAQDCFKKASSYNSEYEWLKRHVEETEKIISA